ncbi:Transcription factor MafA [Oopsacas minuta]|uniref:Transcription factor MafA n=1 Tax=Oopsacas minuta TaxID=111878 RepID=A0AAV7KBX1_9METZ|nr:Transcription factor MafA [Oopsacas minuta]
MSYNELPPNFEFPLLPYMPGGEFTFNPLNYPHLLPQGAVDFQMLSAEFPLPHPAIQIPTTATAQQWSANRDQMVVGQDMPNYTEFEGWTSPEIFYNNQQEGGCADENRSSFSYAGNSPYSRGDNDDKYPDPDSSLEDDDMKDIDLKLPEGISKEDLTNLGIPDLNKKLKEIGVNKMNEKELKRLRRQFKNRGYAQVCREKKNKKKNTMREQKEDLEREIEQLRIDVENLKKERNRYKNQYDKIHRHKLAGFPQGTH